MALANSALASQEDPDPNLHLYPDATPNTYVVTLARSSFVEPTDVSGSTSARSVTPYPLASDVASDVALGYGTKVIAAYNYMGVFSCSMSEAQARSMSHDPRILAVESNAYGHACGTVTPSGWGLDRIDQVSLPLDNTFHYTQTGVQNSSFPLKVRVYVLDTGIYADCTDFAPGQVLQGWPTPSDPYTGPVTPPTFNGLTTSSDDNTVEGHGTPVADIIGGGALGNASRGVAHDVMLYPIKVLDNNGAGTIDSVVAGLDYVRNSRNVRGIIGRGVVNMSLAFRYTTPNTKPTALVTAINNLLSKDVVIVVASDNANKDVSYSCPANLSQVITVGASDTSDHGADFSSIPGYLPNNPATSFGSGVDLFAPGKAVDAYTFLTLSGGGRSTQAGTWSGSSFSAPYASGVIAQYLGNNPTASPAQVQTWLVSSAGPKITGMPAGTTNHLLFTNL